MDRCRGRSAPLHHGATGAGQQALDQSSVVLMFGHGVPGMTCSLDVKAFQNVTMNDNVVLCGSCSGRARWNRIFLPCPRPGWHGDSQRSRKIPRSHDRKRRDRRLRPHGQKQRLPPSVSRARIVDRGTFGRRGIPAFAERHHRHGWFLAGQFILTAADTDNRRAVMRRTGLCT